MWFRDAYPFEMLSKSILADIASKSRSLRVWSAACSSGQEPYSIAMTFLEFKQKNPTAFPGGIEIIATDLSSEMLTKAQTATYDNLSIARGLSEQRKKMFFKASTNANGLFSLNHEVKKLVKFRSLNLLESYQSLGKFDLIFCRNVLIYFAPPIKTKILQQIAAALQSGGKLFLGASESVTGITDEFNMVRCNPGLYFSKKTTKKQLVRNHFLK